MSTVRKSPSSGPGSADIWGFYEPDTGSIQYLAACPETARAAIIDPVWDFNPAAARTSLECAEAIMAMVQDQGLKVEWVLDTHPHADHLTAGAWLAEKTGAPHCIGRRVEEVATLWRDYYNEPDAFDVAKAYDRLFDDGETFRIGNLDARVMLSTGHTLASITYVVGSDAAFVHDTLMYPDSGSSRADFPGGSVEELWDSIQAILALPEDTRLFVGHDYCSNGREPAWEATVAKHKAENVHVKDGTRREDFIRTRTERDRTLDLPDRMLHALQVNLRGGRLPPPEDDGRSYFRIPANRF